MWNETFWGTRCSWTNLAVYFCLCRFWQYVYYTLYNRSLGALRAPRLLGCGPSGLLDNVLHALRALRPCDSRNQNFIWWWWRLCFTEATRLLEFSRSRRLTTGPERGNRDPLHMWFLWRGGIGYSSSWMLSTLFIFPSLISSHPSEFSQKKSRWSALCLQFYRQWRFVITIIIILILWWSPRGSFATRWSEGKYWTF